MDKATRASLSKEDLKILDAYEFVKRTDEKALRRKIQDLVDLAKQVRTEEWAQKREKLRALIAKEDAEFEEEYMKIVQEKVHNDIKERTDKLVEIQKEHGKEVQNLLHLKKIQQHMSSCDDIRLKLRNDLLLETKNSQLIQIEEKRLLAEQEKAHTRIWEEVAKKRGEELDRIDKCKALQRQQQMMKDREILKLQVETAKQLQEEIRKEELEERLRAEAKIKEELELERLALAGEAGRRLQQAKQTQAQLLEAMELKKKRIENEKEFDRMFEKAIEDQHKREQAELAAKVDTLREATLTFLNYLKELKHEKAVEDCELENDLFAFQIKANEKKEKQWMENRQRKAAEAKKAHEELLNQICENRMRQIKEKEQECLDAEKAKERWECEARRDREKERARELFALNYGRELKEQMAAIKQYQAERQKLFEMDIEKAKEDDKHCEEMMVKFMKGDVQYLKAHPNWSLIQCSCVKK